MSNMLGLIGKTIERAYWADDLADLTLIFTDGMQLTVAGKVSSKLNNYAYVMCDITKKAPGE